MNDSLDQSVSPFIDMLKACMSGEHVSFHMPGHNNSSGFSNWLKQNALNIDTTEFVLTDDINHPGEAILHAEKLAAAAFGAGQTFFVTTGASIAVHAAVISLASRGDLIIADRISHSSLIDSCRLYGISVVFGSKEDIPDLITSYPHAALVFVTRPDYYGNAPDIRDIITAAKAASIPVVIDESHGSHYCFAPGIMPRSALSCGADVVIHSAHKTLPVLTQGAFLHISGSYIDSSRFKADIFRNSLRAVSTTSPSFLIAATLDFARSMMALQGADRKSVV